MKIQETKRMFGTIHTEGGDIYVKDYYANGYVIKICLTDNPNEQRVFVGGSLLIAETTLEISREEGPNYGSLFFVRDILLNENMSYLGFKNIDITITDFEDNVLETYTLPEQDSNFNTAYAKKAQVVDLHNCKNLSFDVFGGTLQEQNNELEQLQNELRAKLGTLHSVPNCCTPTKLTTYDLSKAINNCKNYLNGNYTYTNKITEKQIPYAADFLGLPRHVLTKLSSLQAAEILDASFYKKDNLEQTEAVKNHYLKLINYKPSLVDDDDVNFNESRESWNSVMQPDMYKKLTSEIFGKLNKT